MEYIVNEMIDLTIHNIRYNYFFIPLHNDYNGNAFHLMLPVEFVLKSSNIEAPHIFFEYVESVWGINSKYYSDMIFKHLIISLMRHHNYYKLKISDKHDFSLSNNISQ